MRVLVLVLLALLATACGGVLNPPVPTATPVPTAPLPSVPLPPTPEPEPEVWVKNHRLTEMWSGPVSDRGAISFGRTSSTFCVFRIERTEDDARIFVYNPYADDAFWIDAESVGPVEAPELRRGPKPPNQNCADAVYDDSIGTPVATPRATGTPRPALGTTPALSTTPAQTTTPSAQATDLRAGQPLVMALYYPWYDLETWESGQSLDLPAERYISSDPEAIRQHVAWAREAGLDALVSAWYGVETVNPTEQNFRTLLAEAERTGLRAALLLETDNDHFFPSRASTVASLRHLLRVHAAHPAYLRIDGRPVILVWRPQSVYASNGSRVNAKSLAAVDAWSAIIAEVDPDRRAIWIAEGDYVEMLRAFDGLFPYSIAWSQNPANQLLQYGQAVRSRAQSLGSPRIWAATAMPGYDDTRIAGRPDTFAVARQDGAYYQRTFQGAIDSNPDWVVITSFNEWLEGTQIEPAVAYGRRYLDLTRTYVERFKQQAASRPTPTPTR